MNTIRSTINKDLDTMTMISILMNEEIREQTHLMVWEELNEKLKKIDPNHPGEGYYFSNYQIRRNTILVMYQKIGNIARFPAGTKLYHCSDCGDIEHLRSSVASTDLLEYGEHRIYFSTTTELSMLHVYGTECYEYTCDGTEVFRVDTHEMQAVYMCSDKPLSLAVRKV